jgi:putative hydrolase of HD superfamily
MKPLANFLYEVGLLSKVRRSGWWLAGVDQPESVAEHSFRTAVIAYALALLEGADPELAAAVALFHDIHEARILDMHKVGQQYADWGPAEAGAMRDQLRAMPPPLARAVRRYQAGFRDLRTKESVIARDADHLECLVRAREYQEVGYAEVKDWIANSRKRLRTASAKRLAKACIEVKPQEWWEGLKRQIVADE